MGRLVKAKPASECKYGDWRDNIDWKAGRVMLPIGGGIILLTILLMIFGG